MALADELKAKVATYARTKWEEIPQGRVVPTANNLTAGNTGIHIDATVLYADIDGSTNMVDTLLDRLAAEYYKAYLECAAKIIRVNDGEITAYDGDRVMAIFIGDQQVANAVTAALQINRAVQEIVNPTFQSIYTVHHLPLRHTIGIDKSLILATKIGIRGDNDIVWVGPAANYAAKLNSFDGLDSSYAIRITEQAFNALGTTVFYRKVNGQTIWEGPYSNLQRGKHYRTSCSMDIE